MRDDKRCRTCNADGVTGAVFQDVAEQLWARVLRDVLVEAADRPKRSIHFPNNHSPACDEPDNDFRRFPTPAEDAHCRCAENVRQVTL